MIANDFIPDCVFPTDNEAEIPSLRLDMQPEVCDSPFVCYGEQKRTFKMNHQGTLHFYTDDYRFQNIYEHPEKVLNPNPRNIVEPNFSLFNEMPVAFAMQRIYKKRWISRMMQERGIKVFVDLNVAGKFYKLNMMGVPLGYHSFCTRGYSDRLHYLEYEYELALSWAGENAGKMIFVIYGGGLECKRFARKYGCVYITPVVCVVQKLDKSLKKIENNVAFLSEEFRLAEMVPDKQKLRFKGMIEDFREDSIKYIKDE